MIRSWIALSLAREGFPPTREGVRLYLESKVRGLLKYVMDRSIFYRERLGEKRDLLEGPEPLSRFREIPFTTAEDIVRRHYEFLCVPLSDVQRGYTVEAASGGLKRIFFTKSDLMHIIDAIRSAFNELGAGGKRVAILFPREHEWGIPDLMAKAIEGTGGTAIHLSSSSLDGLYNDLRALSPHLIVGSAQQIFYLSLHILRERYGKIRTEAIIASHGCLPYILSGKMRESIKRAWDIEPLEHFGLTEAGFIVALECRSHRGLHINEADVFVEIVDPKSGDQLPPGEIGELVLTSLNQKAMPIIRYRAGYLARMEEGPCPCGDDLSRILKIHSTITEADVFTSPAYRLF